MMNRFLKYLKAQSKRATKVFPFVLIFVIILSLALSFLVGGLIVSEDTTKNQKVNIGITGNINDTYLGIGIFAIKEFDSSKQYVEFVEYDTTDSAAKALKNNEIMSYIEIPDGFVASVMSGENIPLNYVANNSPAIIGPVMMNECVGIVSEYLIEAQRGIYALGDVATDYHVEYNVYSQNVDGLNLRYIDSVLNRDKLCSSEYVGVGNGLSFKSYYIIAVIILMFMLWGTTATPYLVHKDMALQRLLSSRRIKSSKQILAEYMPFFAMMFVSAVLVFGTIFACFGSFLNDLEIFSTRELSAVTFVSKLILPILLVSSMQFFVFELNSTVLGGMFSQLLATIVLSFASGFLFPSYALPQIMQKVGAILPTGVAFDYIKNILRGEEVDVLPLFCYVVAFLTLSMFIRSAKLRRNQQ